MNICTIEMTNFMRYAASEVHLPPQGVVVVTGPNGSGKSSMIEAVAVACWGKTLRSTPPWATGADQCAVHVDVDDGLLVTRRRSGARTSLEWDTDPRSEMSSAYDVVRRLGPEQWENTTKAQEALERIIGPFDVWRRSCVFSSQDAAHFTLATDGERKRLLEAILGLDRFDSALEACRKDLKAFNDKALTAQRRHDQSAVRLEAERKRLADAEGSLANLGAPPAAPPVIPSKGGAFGLAQMIAASERDIAGLRAQLRAADGAGGEFVAQERQARALLDRLRSPHCPTCTQLIAEALRARLQKEADDARAGAEKARAEASRGREALEGEIEDLEGERASLQKQRQDILSAEKLASAAALEQERYEHQRAHLDGVAQQARATVEALEVDVVALAAARAEAELEAAELEACERVLGLKGVRANILGKALTGLEAVSNSWLGRLCSGSLSLTLKPYSEKKSGGVSDSIALDVLGAGGGHGYRAASGGERRRIDVALLLALAEVAGAAHGRVGGTLFFDEVFDALDVDGVDAVVSALGDLAATRAVVVITHNQDLAARLPATQHIKVDEGQVEA